MPRVSVVLPVHDVAPYVEATIRTILDQTWSDFELIVVDDGSTDGTGALVEAIADPRINVHGTGHGGLVAAENAGIGLARGEYVVRCDGDDVYAPTLFERQVEVLDGHPETAAVGAWVRQFGSRQSFRPAPVEPADIRRRLRRQNALSQPVMMRASVVRELGGFRAVTWEDWDLWIRMAARHDLRNIPDCLVAVRARADSTYWTWPRRRVRAASLETRLVAARELGMSPGSVAAVLAGAVARVGAPLVDVVTPRRRPGPSGAVAPAVSVVIPTYARPGLLQRCLDGVDRQRQAAAEVIVVCRPEDEATARLVRTWTVRDPERRRIVHVDRPGLVHALAAGTRAVRHPAVAYLDDDAVPDADWLAELGRGLLDPTVGAVGGRIVDHVDGVPKTGRTRTVGRITWYGRVIGRHHLDTNRHGDVEWLTGSNMAFRAELARHDEGLIHTSNGLALANDLDVCLSVRRAGRRVLYSPWARVDHFATSFRDPSLGTRVSGSDVATSAANHTYALLKYLSPARRAAFLGYAFVVGQASLPGPVRALAEVPQSPRRSRAMAGRIPLVWRGRLQGIRMWRAWRSAPGRAAAERAAAERATSGNAPA